MLNKKSFTLLELIVVVAIMAILVSILLPSLLNARVEAKVAVCASNQKQIGEGMYGYSSDNSSCCINKPATTIRRPCNDS